MNILNRPDPEKDHNTDKNKNPGKEDLDIRLGGQQGPVIKYYVERDVVGYGRIDALMKDPSIEDISCDSSTVPVFVFHREHGYIMSNVKFADDTELNRYVKKLIQDSGKHISISIPIIDATIMFDPYSVMTHR